MALNNGGLLVKGRPRMFKSDLVKVTIRIPESLKSRIQEYANRKKIKFNEATRRLFLEGLEGQYLMEQGFNWFQMFFESATESPLFKDFKASLIEILSRFLIEYFENNPEVLIRGIAGFIGGHLKYSENVLGLDMGRLVEAVAGEDPEAKRRMSELLDNILWVTEWIHR